MSYARGGESSQRWPALVGGSPLGEATAKVDRVPIGVSPISGALPCCWLSRWPFLGDRTTTSPFGTALFGLRQATVCCLMASGRRSRPRSWIRRA